MTHCAAKKKDVELITLKEKDGNLARAESRVAVLNAIDKYLAAHIGQ